MKKIIIAVLVSAVLSLSATAYATSTDAGKISEVYVPAYGTTVAIKLQNGFTNANAANECAGNNGFAGLFGTAPEVFTKVLTAAKISGSSVTVTTGGCEGTTGWLKILNVYIQ